jgi:guanylate kinase
MLDPKHKLVIITAPSGAGKTSITRHLLRTFPDQLSFSISAATRERRQYEKEGVDYYFMTVQEFQEKIQANSFIEWEMVYEGKYYGTLKSEIKRIWTEKKTPLLDIDVQGAIHVEEQNPENTLSLFIEAPSLKELEIRLRSRGTETPESITARLNKASYELSFKLHFDHIIVNKDLDLACKQAEIVVGEFLRQKR